MMHIQNKNSAQRYRYTHEYLRGTNYYNLIYTVKTNLPIRCPVCIYDVVVLDTQGEQKPIIYVWLYRIPWERFFEMTNKLVQSPCCAYFANIYIYINRKIIKHW